MTIYAIELSPETLGRLPSINHAVDLCLHFSQRILTHLRDVVLINEGEAQRVINNQSSIIGFCLGMLHETTSANARAVHAMNIMHVDITTQMFTWSPKFYQGFTIDTLSSVYPKALLDLLIKLIDDLTTNLIPLVRSLPPQVLHLCIETLQTALTILSHVLNNSLNRDGNIAVFVYKPLSLIVHIRVEFCDHRPEVRYLFPLDRYLTS